MKLSSVLVAIPLMAFLAILQVAVLPRFPIFGSVPSLPFLFALAWGLLRGANAGAVWGFLAGFFTDLFSIAPFGGTSLTYMIAIVTAVLINDVLPKNRFLIPMLLTALATSIQQVLYYLYMRLFGYDTFLNTSVLSVIVLQAILILPIYWALFLIQRSLWPKPVEI